MTGLHNPLYRETAVLTEANNMDYRGTTQNSELYDQLLALPKIELHRHLEGSLRLATLSDIARDYEIDLPGYEVEDFRHMVQIVPTDTLDANFFLSKFKVLREFYRSPAIIDRITYEAVADAAAENIVYMELRFTPKALANNTGSPLDEVTDVVIEAVNRAMQDFDIDVTLIASMNRHESVEIGMECMSVAIDRMDRGIVGLDLAGAEHKFGGEPFIDIFREAREAGMNLTIHAGEWAGAESVREAIEDLGALRLGHGVRIVEDANVMAMAKERGIAFEMCPTSNVQSGVMMDLRRHPIRDLYALGMLTTLDTDDPSISAINLTDEFVLAVDRLGFSIDDVKQHILNAAHASFLPDDRRDALVKRLEKNLLGEAATAG